jgi:hypothetical protein
LNEPLIEGVLVFPVLMELGFERSDLVLGGSDTHEPCGSPVTLPFEKYLFAGFGESIDIQLIVDLC